MINLLVFVVVNVQKATQMYIFIPQSLIIVSDDFQCREDEASMAFFQLIAQETIVKALVFLGKGVGFFILKRVILCKQIWKPDFKTSEEIVWVLYYQVLMWFSIIIFPSLAIAQPLLLYFLYQVFYIYIMFLAQRPMATSNKDSTGMVI